MKTFFRIFSLALAFIFSVAVAVFAGAFLAAWDTGSAHDVYAMILPNEEPVQEIPHKIVKKDSDLKGALDTVPEMTAEVKGFYNITLPDSSDDTKEAKPLTDAINGDDEGSQAENAKQKTDDDSAEADLITNRQVKKTDEISGIDEIIKAGSSDEVTFTSIENQDNTPASGGTQPTLDPIESYPLPFTRVDESYFEDALFIGDSRMQGFGMYSKVKSTFYAQTAFQLYQYKTFKVVQTPEGKVPIFDAMPYDRFTKIYIKVGLNEFGISDEAFINVYTQFINDLRLMQPRAIIYIHAILPVTASKSSSDKTHNNANIARRNAVLKNFAEVMKCYYVDVAPYVTDETGALIADSAADGIHMSGKYMPQWVEGLCNQAVLWPQ